ncbi:MAG: Lhr family helicase, partial [Opitutaceae bacterium]
LPEVLGVTPRKAGRTPAHPGMERTRSSNGSHLEDALEDWLKTEPGLPEAGARQLATYFAAIRRALGVIPSQRTLVLERFFDESGGMQLVLHSPFGSRVNRAWGLALRKRFCRSFNFELQAAASDDAIVISLGTQHSFPLDEVFRYINSRSVRELLVQALLDAPMFPIRWRWNASRALALPRQRGGRKIPAPLQRMESENLLAAVFPDQLACPENLVGDREVPDHPLVRQTIDDCLTEAMDIDGLIAVLRRIERGTIRCVARDLPEPSPLAHEILNAKPYAFLDNAPLEERRTQAVYLRRATDASSADDLGRLDPAAIESVCAEAWPRATNADELHEALLLVGALSDEEARRVAGDTSEWLELLVSHKRAGRLASAPAFWVAAERWPMIEAIYPNSRVEPSLVAPESECNRTWERAQAVRELVRGRIEVIGPVTAAALADYFQLPPPEIEAALLGLEGEGFVLRGKFRPGAAEVEWCDRRLLARIHRLTINRLRAEIQPAPIASFQRFLLAWQRVDAEHRAEGLEGVRAVLELFDGYEFPAAAWEPEVLALRVKDYAPAWLDQLCFTGRIGWGRLTTPQSLRDRSQGDPRLFPRSPARQGTGSDEEVEGRKSKVAGRMLAPVRNSPVALFARENLAHWLALATVGETAALTVDAQQVYETLLQGGALFFGEAVRKAGLLPTRVEQALAELVAQGRVTADSFEGLRALLLPEEKRASHGAAHRPRRRRAITSVEFAGRWSVLRAPAADGEPAASREEAIEAFARVLLRRHGVVFRRMLERESLNASWFELVRVYRRLEARGEIRGGHFVSGVSGEQFALPEAIGLLRSIRRAEPRGELVTISAADPLNLAGILTPGPRIASITAHRILLRDGVPIAALKAGEIIALEREPAEAVSTIERALRVGQMSPALRPYYA